MPVVWPSLQSMLMAYCPTRLMRLGADVFGDGRRLQQRAAGGLLDAPGAPAGEAQVARAVAGLVAVGPLDGDRRPQQADDLVGHRHGGASAPRAPALQQQLQQRRGVQRLHEAAVADQRLDVGQRHQVDADVFALLRRRGARASRLRPGRCASGCSAARGSPTASSAPTSARRRSRSPRPARAAPPPAATCRRGRSCRRGSRSGPAPIPWRYWRMSTTCSSAVSATTLTHGGCSLIQYFGMTVPLGSCDAIDAHRVPGLARQVLAGEHTPRAGIVVERHRRRMLLLPSEPSKGSEPPAISYAGKPVALREQRPRTQEHRPHHVGRQLLRCSCSAGWGGSCPAARAAPGPAAPRCRAPNAGRGRGRTPCASAR